MEPPVWQTDSAKIQHQECQKTGMRIICPLAHGRYWLSYNFSRLMWPYSSQHRETPHNHYQHLWCRGCNPIMYTIQMDIYVNQRHRIDITSTLSVIAPQRKTTKYSSTAFLINQHIYLYKIGDYYPMKMKVLQQWWIIINDPY